MENKNNELPIIVDGTEFYKKDIEELRDFVNTLMNVCVQSDFECNLFKKKYLEQLEKNGKLEKKIKDMELKNN